MGGGGGGRMSFRRQKGRSSKAKEALRDMGEFISKQVSLSGTAISFHWRKQAEAMQICSIPGADNPRPTTYLLLEHISVLVGDTLTRKIITLT